MNLYEIILSFCGESYVRAYAWATDERHAQELFEAKHRGTKYEKSIERIVLLMNHEADPFCTEANDAGWDAKDGEEPVFRPDYAIKALREAVEREEAKCSAN